MIGRIIEIATDGVHLSVERGFMTVTQKKKGQDREELGRIVLDDIAALIVHGHGASFTANLAARLADRGAPLVICGSNHSPIALLWPLHGHYEQGMRMQKQAEKSKPLGKRLWRDLVRAKILSQAAALTLTGHSSASLKRMARTVKSGDPQNLEAQAARHYWSNIMGKNFRRDRDQTGANAQLNYGYMVLRAATARAILAAGLHPSLSIHHQSRGDALRLSDDLMEPFRVYIDLTVVRLQREGRQELDKDSKAALASVTSLDLETGKGASPVQNCLDSLAISLAQIYMGQEKKLALPTFPPDLMVQ